MNKIPVIIVDDDETDRYIARRRLTKDDAFGEIMEAKAGDVFLTQFFEGDPLEVPEDTPFLVLMDVNMPRMDGFETVEELRQRIKAGKGPSSIVVMMFTSSSNPADIARAQAHETIKGYITKPLDAEGMEQIRDAYFA